MLRELQESVRRGLFDPAATAAMQPDGVALIDDHIPAGQRFAVYRNNVLGSLTEALAAAFPVVHRLVGDGFFRYAARLFIADHPPAMPQLLSYGGDFPEFLAAFPPAGSVPYLADVARLEWARTEALFAADAAPLTAADLATIPPEDMADLAFRLHPTVRWVASPWPIQTIWEANQPEHENLPQVDLGAGGEAVLVLRPGMAVEAQRLSPGDVTLVSALGEGATLAEAADAAATAEPGFDLQAALLGHLMRGSFAGVPAAPHD